MGLFDLINSKRFDNINKMLNRFTSEMDDAMSSLDKEMSEFENVFENKFDDFKKYVKDLTEKFIVEVPYDRDNETLTYSINGNVITVNVECCENSENSKKTTITTTLPKNADIEHMKQTYSKEEKKMFFTFDKVKNVNVDTLKNGISTFKESVRGFYDDLIASFEKTTKSKDEPSDGFEDVETEREISLDTESTTMEDDKASIIKKAIALRSLGWSYRKIAKELGVSDKTVGRWIKLNS